MGDLLTLFLLTVAAIGCIAFGFFCGAQLLAAIWLRDWQSLVANTVMLILAACSFFSVLSMSMGVL